MKTYDNAGKGKIISYAEDYFYCASEFKLNYASVHLHYILQTEIEIKNRFYIYRTTPLCMWVGVYTLACGLYPKRDISFNKFE